MLELLTFELTFDWYCDWIFALLFGYNFTCEFTGVWFIDGWIECWIYCWYCKFDWTGFVGFIWFVGFVRFCDIADDVLFGLLIFCWGIDETLRWLFLIFKLLLTELFKLLLTIPWGMVPVGKFLNLTKSSTTATN